MNAFLQEIYGQPAALRDTAAFLKGSGALEQAAALWHSGRYKRLLLTGMGSSDFVACAGALLLAQAGLPATFLNAGEWLHYGPERAEDALTVCISQSGESYEVVQLLPRLGTVIALCNTPDSTLARRADCLLLTRAGREEMTSTKTFITAWQAMLMLTEALGGQANQDDWSALADTLQAALALDVAPAVRLLGDPAFVQTVGRGPVMAAASQSALMWMEAAHIPASALSGGNFRHGPLEMAHGGMPVLIFTHSASRTYAQSLRLAQDVLRCGGKVLFLSDGPAPLPEERVVQLCVPCPREALAPITTVVPVQLLVHAWAVAHGMTPGDFSHGAKVTVSE